MRNYNLKDKYFSKMEMYDGGAMFIGAYVLQLLLQFIFSIILVTTKVAESFTTSFAGICIVAVLNEIAMIATPLAYSKIRSTNLFADMGVKVKMSAWQVLTIIAIAGVTIAAFAPIANGFVNLVVMTGYDQSAMAEIEVNSVGKFFIALFIMCILPAICEELLYRGMIGRAFADKGYIFAVFMSGLFFALMHGNPIQLIHQFFLGCVCCAVYFLTRSFWSAVIVHFFNNFIAILGNFIGFLVGKQLAYKWWVGLIISIAGICALGGLFFLLYKLCVARRKKEDFENNRVFANVAEKEIGVLFESKTEVEAYELDKSILDKQLDECANEEMKEVLRGTRKEESAAVRKKNKLSLIYSLVIAIAIWILNTALNYLS
ncbi:MAG: type II CAAX endopeptidase family protein [Clostridia bacterium]